ncbi:MAG: DUF4397 domain-containing protein [Myxococcota bacterium]
MRKSIHFVLIAGASWFALDLVGCTSLLADCRNTGTCIVPNDPLSAGGGGSGGGGSTLAGGGGAGGDPNTGGSATIQLGHINRGLGPVDVCLAVNGGDFERLTDGGLSYPSITSSTEISPGDHEIYLVAVDAECTEPLAEFDLSLPDGFEGTLSLLGFGEGDATLLAVPESLSGPTEGQAEIVFVHAAPGIASADLGIFVLNGSFVALAESTTYPSASPIAITAENLPLENASLGVGPAGRDPIGAISGVNLPANSQLTVYVVNDDRSLGIQYFPVFNGSPGDLTAFDDPSM